MPAPCAHSSMSAGETWGPVSHARPWGPVADLLWPRYLGARLTDGDNEAQGHAAKQDTPAGAHYHQLRPIGPQTRACRTLQPPGVRTIVPTLQRKSPRSDLGSPRSHSQRGHPGSWVCGTGGPPRREPQAEGRYPCRCARLQPAGIPGGSSTGRSRRCWRTPGCSAGPRTHSHLLVECWGSRGVLVAPEVRAKGPAHPALSPRE